MYAPAGLHHFRDTIHVIFHWSQDGRVPICRPRKIEAFGRFRRSSCVSTPQFSDLLCEECLREVEFHLKIRDARSYVWGRTVELE